ncbi:MAG: hypothetical protein DRN90_02950 [Thermoproteota archaeon]|nr:MAG: hypothetical protein DRN90_02950 [Candidatus Korarchaeota archaeon]
MEDIIAALRISTTFLLAALGELMIERSGVLNLGIEGVMTLGAFSAFITAYFTGNPLLGFLVSCAIGAAIGLLTYILLVDLGTKPACHLLGNYIAPYFLKLLPVQNDFLSTNSPANR